MASTSTEIINGFMQSLAVFDAGNLATNREPRYIIDAHQVFTLIGDTQMKLQGRNRCIVQDAVADDSTLTVGQISGLENSLYFALQQRQIEALQKKGLPKPWYRLPTAYLY